MAIGIYLTIMALIGLSYVTYRAKATYLRADADIYNTLQFGALLWIGFVAAKAVQATSAATGWILIESEMVWLVIEAVLLAGGTIFVTVGLLTWFKRLVDSRSGYHLALKKAELFTLAPQLATLPRGCEKLIDRLQEDLAELFSATSCRFRMFDSIADAAEIYGDEHAQVLNSGNCVYLPPPTIGHRRSKILIPVAANHPSWGVIALEVESHGEKASADLRILQKLARLLNIGAAQNATLVEPENNRVDSLRSELRLLTRGHDTANGLDQLVPGLYTVLRKFANFEILRLGIFEARGSIVRQFCLGPNGNLLNELDRSLIQGVTEMRQLFSTMKVRRCSTLSQSKHDDLRFLGTCGAEWSLSIPLGNLNSVDAVLTLAGSGREIGDEDAAYMGEEVIAAILPLVHQDNLKRELETANHNFLKLGDALKLQEESSTPRQALQSLAQSIVTELPTSLCQIWTFDSRDERLNLIARAQASSVSSMMRVAHPVALAEAEWHRRVVVEGRYMVVSQQHPEFQMSDHEAALTCCAQMKSALIVPVKHKGIVRGVITIAEVREQSRRSFTLTDIKLAQTIALIAAQVLSSDIGMYPARELQERVRTLEQNRVTGELFADLPQKLATPLTSIMARSDLILSSLGAENNEVSRNLRVIRRQAEKITSAIQVLSEYRRNERSTRGSVKQFQVREKVDSRESISASIEDTS